LPASCSIDWGFPAAAGKEPDLAFSLDLILKSTDAGANAEAVRKLKNLGYADQDFAMNTWAFQRDYGQLASPPLSPSGTLDAATSRLLDDVYRTCGDDLRNTPIS
jgi:hypothetical protein